MKLRTKRALAVAGGAAALSLALSGCGALGNLIGGGGNDAQRDEDTGEVTEGSDIDIFSLKLGDCIPQSAMSDGETNESAVVPCSEPHGYEVYHEFELADGEFPGSEAIQEEVLDKCVPEFGTFVGLAYEESSLDLTWYEPTQESWDSGNDRLVQCLVLDPEGEVEGSLEGAAR